MPSDPPAASRAARRSPARRERSDHRDRRGSTPAIEGTRPRRVAGTAAPVLALLTVLAPLALPAPFSDSEARAAAPATPSTAVAPQAAEPDDADDADDEVAFTRSVLLDPGSADEVRRRAAERLVRAGTPAAIEALAAALRSEDATIVGTTVNALARTDDADGAVLAPLVAPLLEALPRAPIGLLDPIGLLLSRVDKEDRGPVRALAMDARRPPTERLAAIHVLGVLATIESGDALIELSNPARTDDPAVRRAAREALARMVGRDLGDDHEAWASWWSSARRRGLADWWREIRRRDREQIARLQSDLDALAARHVDLLRQLYAGFNDAAPSAREVELLQAHLGDPVPAVRRFAVTRVERLVRDSIPVPPPLLAPIAARLDDEVPAIRAAAVRLLDELRSPELATELAARLPSEPDPAAASAMLEVLGRRGATEAADAIVARIEVPATAPAAARAAWLLARDADLPTAARERAAELADRRLAEDPTAADAARLLATIGDEPAIEGLIARLDAETPPAVATAIAEGLVARGRLEPLLAAAELPAVRPVLVDALADGEPTEPQLVRLLELEPPAADVTRRSWEGAVARLARRLPAWGVLAVDAPMASRPGRPVLERRQLVLVPAVRAAAEEGREDAPDLARAACSVLIELGRAAEAWTLLEGLGPVAAHETLRTPRARACMLTGRYDEAAALDPDPSTWLDTLAETVARSRPETNGDASGPARPDPVAAEAASRAADTARRLAAEIARRFDGGLDAAQRAELERMLASITPGEGDAGPTGSEGDAAGTASGL